MQLTPEEIESRLRTHEVGAEGWHKIEQLRDLYAELAQLLNNTGPDGREKSLALTALEESMMWASKAIAKPYPLTSYKDLEGRRPVVDEEVHHGDPGA
jgi:hypothetical protein